MPPGLLGPKNPKGGPLGVKKYWIYGYPKLYFDETKAVLKTKFENIQNSPRKCPKTAKKEHFFISGNFWQFLKEYALPQKIH